MGVKNAGKTSIHATLFADFTAFETKSLPFTNSIIESKVQFLGHNLKINDCGGQKDLINHYLKNISPELFRSVGFLIYVFDIQFLDKANELDTFVQIVNRLLEFSKSAKVFVLLHKMDLIPKANRDKEVTDKKKLIGSLVEEGVIVDIFATSVLTSSLYSAWSVIVKHIIPDLKLCDKTLASVAKTMLCDEIILVEKYTFLVLGSFSALKTTEDEIKYFKISRMIKSFKIECSKNGKEITSIQIKNKHFSVIMYGFTNNTYILLLFYNRDFKPALIVKNLELASRIFQSNKDSELKNLQHIW